MLTQLQSRVLRELRSTVDKGRDGTTVSVTGDVPTTGYMTGGAVRELIMSPDDDASALSEWVAENSGSYFGCWKNSDTGNYHFDVSEHYDAEDSALLVARARGELAIWSLAESREIPV